MVVPPAPSPSSGVVDPPGPVMPSTAGGRGASRRSAARAGASCRASWRTVAGSRLIGGMGLFGCTRLIGGTGVAVRRRRGARCGLPGRARSRRASAVDVGVRPGGTSTTAATAAASLCRQLGHVTGRHEDAQRHVNEYAERGTFHHAPPSDCGCSWITGTTSIFSAPGGGVNSNSAGSVGKVVDHLLKRAV